ncbi:uncharacterized protein LOC135195862 [Macrobrachium nipponense]|uniref:uncharacterized protein LOC135195862 n=1 Tax=Macrobrachium nipponense TaxID=159736 RepID=UPI0030C82385
MKDLMKTCGFNWRVTFEKELHLCETACQSLLDFRKENRVRRILDSTLNYIGLSNVVGYEEPTLPGCNGPLGLLVRKNLHFDQGAAAHQVLRKVDQYLFWPKMLMFLTTIYVTVLIAKGVMRTVGEKLVTWNMDWKEEVENVTEVISEYPIGGFTENPDTDVSVVVFEEESLELSPCETMAIIEAPSEENEDLAVCYQQDFNETEQEDQHEDVEEPAIEIKEQNQEAPDKTLEEDSLPQEMEEKKEVEHDPSLEQKEENLFPPAEKEMQMACHPEGMIQEDENKIQEARNDENTHAVPMTHNEQENVASTGTQKRTRPVKCGPLKRGRGKTFTFRCAKGLDFGQIIGKGGKFTKLAKEDHGVILNVRDDGSRLVQLTGPKMNVDKVYREIKFRVDKTFDLSELPQVTKGLFAVGKEEFIVIVGKEFKEALLGPKNINLQRLFRQLKVSIYLPDDDDDHEYIGMFGPLEQAKEAYRVILAMMEDIKNWPKEEELKLVGLNCYEFCLPPKGRAFLKGLYRQLDKEISHLYDVKLILPQRKDKKEAAYLGGDMKQVARAYQHVQEVLQELKLDSSNITTEGLKRIDAGRYQFEVNAQLKGLVVGSKGQNLMKIEKKHSVRITMHAKTENYITINGHLDDVQEACRDIKEITEPARERKGGNFQPVELLPGLTKIGNRQYMTVLNRQEIAIVIGKRGQTIKKVTSKHNVYFHGPKRNESTDKCTITGDEKDVISFYNEVQDILKKKQDERSNDWGNRGHPRPLVLGDFF